MAVALQLDFSELGLGDYDKTCEALNFPTDWPDGLLAHTALEVDGQLRVLDVWNSRQHFDRFVEQRLQSGMAQALGDRAKEPEIAETEVHRFQAHA